MLCFGSVYMYKSRESRDETICNHFGYIECARKRSVLISKLIQLLFIPMKGGTRHVFFSITFAWNSYVFFTNFPNQTWDLRWKIGFVWIGQKILVLRIDNQRILITSSCKRFLNVPRQTLSQLLSRVSWRCRFDMRLNLLTEKNE